MTAWLRYIGISYKTAPLEVRERIAADRERLVQMLQRAKESTAECAILSTCGRFELYIVPNSAAHAPTKGMFAELTHLSPGAIEGFAETLGSESAARRLMRVAAGLESQILGEDQILGQVRDAFRLAVDAGGAGPMLSATFRAAIHAGKRVRSETQLGRASRSFARLAAERVTASCPGNDRRVVVVGTGRLAAEVVHHVAATGASVIVVGRDVERAATLAGGSGAGVGLDGLSDALARANGVVTCTSSPTVIVTPKMLQGGRPPITIVDLGVPRNVEPSIEELAGVTLIHLDRLAPRGSADRSAIVAAEQIVKEELERLMRWIRRRNERRMIIVRPAEGAAA